MDDRRETHADVAALLAAGKAIEALTEHNSTFSRADLIKATAEVAQIEGISADHVLRAAEKTLKTRDVVPLGVAHENAAIANHPGLSEIRYTTRQILAMEKKILAQVETGRGRSRAIVSEEITEWAISEKPTIKEEQAAAVRHIVSSPDQVRTVTGQAGTGKTFMLAVAADAWERAGFTVRGVAPSAKAASGMEEGAGFTSTTIHSWLWAVENGKEKLDKNTVIVMDEAGMTDTKIMAQVMHHIWDSGSTLVLIGDAGQLQAVQQGGSFKAIDELLGKQVRLTDIIRQEKEGDRQAVRDMAGGRAGKALNHFQESGNLTVATDSDAARGSLLADWMKSGLTKPEDQLIVTGTNLDACLLNREIQSERIRTGCLLQNQSVSANGENF